MHTATAAGTALTTLALLTSTALAQTPSLVLFPQDGSSSAFISMARSTGEVVASGPNFSRFIYRNGAWSPLTVLGSAGTVKEISPDGRSFVGDQSAGYLTWTQSSGVRPIGLPAGRTFDSSSTSSWVGNNANYVIANFQSGTDRKPFKWTQATGWQQLPNPGLTATRVFDVTPDGTAMVGQALDFASSDFYLYREGVGITNLGGFRAAALNDTGTVMVGSRRNPNSVFETSLLRQPVGDLVELGLVNGFAGSIATDLSNDASVVVGRLFLADGINSSAFIWTPQQGMRTITAVAADYGIAFPTHQSVLEIALSADGGTIAGTFESGPSLNTFILTIPAPTTALPLAMTALLATRRRR